MRAKTEEALKESIRHWRLIVQEIKNHLGDTFEYGGGVIKVFNFPIFQYNSRACDLCTLFINNDCKACPVKMKTKEALCHNSPWQDFGIHLTETTQIDKTCLKLAKAELSFLVKLLPKKEKK